MVVDVIFIQDTGSSIYDTANVLGKSDYWAVFMGETSDGLTAARKKHKIKSLYDAISYLLKLSGKQIQRKFQCQWKGLKLFYSKPHFTTIRGSGGMWSGKNLIR
jgi:hypothetical protein